MKREKVQLPSMFDDDTEDIKKEAPRLRERLVTKPPREKLVKRKSFPVIDESKSTRLAPVNKDKLAFPYKPSGEKTHEVLVKDAMWVIRMHENCFWAGIMYELAIALQEHLDNEG